MDVTSAFTLESQAIWLGRPPESLLGLVVMRPGIGLQSNGVRIVSETRVRGRVWPWQELRGLSAGLAINSATQNAVDGLMDALMLHPSSILGAFRGRTVAFTLEAHDSRGNSLAAESDAPSMYSEAEVREVRLLVTGLLRAFASSATARQSLENSASFRRLLQRLQGWEGDPRDVEQRL